jgi:hypothetical protein
MINVRRPIRATAKLIRPLKRSFREIDGQDAEAADEELVESIAGAVKRRHR